MDTNLRKGRLSVSEIEELKHWAGKITYEELGKRMGRDPESLRDKAKKMGLDIVDKFDRAIQAEYDIKTTPYWKELEKQFSDDELDLFLNHWKEIIAQFKDDEVLHTEKIQVMDVIKIEVLMNRYLKQEKDMLRQVRDLHDMIEVEKSKEIEVRDLPLISQLERQVAALYSTQKDIGKLYKDLQTEKKQLFGQLKATREQRIKRIESSKETAAGWITKLLTRPDLRRQLGYQMEKMRLATDVEIQRLSEWHQYEDGQLDQPFLNCDTVRGDDE